MTTIDNTKTELREDVSLSKGSFAESTRADARALRSGAKLRQAFLSLIERKPLDQITIRDIADEAGVHQATFYRHHPTKQALLDAVAKEQIAELVRLTLPILDSADSQAANLALCEYVYEHRVIWSALLTGGAAGAMREEWLRISLDLAVERTPCDPWLPPELGVECSIDIMFNTLAWWLGKPADEVPIGTASLILHRLLAAVLGQK